MAVDPRFWAGRRVLVTGQTGFKGSWLSLWLQAMGAEAVGFAKRFRNGPSLYALADVGDDVRLIEGDVRDADAVASAVADVRPEVVFHLAAQPIVRLSYRDPVGTYATNVMGTLHVLDAVRATSGVRVVVNVTTDKVYENHGWEWGYRESEPLGGDDPYSSSKACSELVTAAYRHSFFSGGDAPRVATARAGNVIGGGDFGEDRLVPDVMRAALTDEPVVVRNPRSIRPWQHVLNPLAGYLLLAQRLWDSPELAGAWNFGPPDEDARPVGWVVERLAELWPSGIAHELGGGDGPPEAGLLKLDSARARLRLGWHPVWMLEQALEATVDWFVAYRDGGDMRAVALAQIAAFQDGQQRGVAG